MQIFRGKLLHNTSLRFFNQLLKGRLYSTKNVRDIGQPSAATHPHLLKEGEITPGITSEEYVSRRKKLLELLPEKSVAIVAAAQVNMMNEVVPYNFRQDADYLYITGCQQPGGIAVLGHDFGLCMFMPEPSPQDVTWQGEVAGVDAALDTFKAEQAYPMSKLNGIVNNMIENSSTLFHNKYTAKQFYSLHSSPAHSLLFLHRKINLKMAEENIGEQEISVMPEVGGVPEAGSVPEAGGVLEAGSVPEAGGVPEMVGMPEKDSVPDEEGMPELGGAPEFGGVPEIGGVPEMGGMTEMGGITNDSNPPEVHESGNDQKSDSAVNDSEKKWPGWPGENVFRLLVPVQKVGSIIGRKGEYIKKTCEETKARIKVLDGPPGTTERTVMISAKELPDVAIPPAVDGLLKVHKRIVDVDVDPAHAPPGAGGTVCTRMLVAATQGGSLIGKQGATIKSIQDASNCIIRVLGRENLPVFALPDDGVVEVQGEAAGVHKAIELIANHLRKFLVDRSVIGIFEMQMQSPNTHGNQDAPPPQSWGPQSFSMNTSGGHGFAPNHQYAPPPRQFDNYYPPADMPPIEKQPRSGPPAYGRDMTMGTQPNMQPHQSMVTKVSRNMQIPLTYADAVIGTSGTNISYIRRASGATIAIQETRGVPDEMTVEINGSASEVQTAQQLIQNSIADAANAAQNVPAAPGQGYNPYPNHGAAYLPHQQDGAGHAPAGDYGSVYGNYGY